MVFNQMNHKIFMTFQKRNWRSENKWPVVVMVTWLPSYFYFQKMDNLTEILWNFILWQSVQYSVSYCHSKTVEQMPQSRMWRTQSSVAVGNFFLVKTNQFGKKLFHSEYCTAAKTCFCGKTNGHRYKLPNSCGVCDWTLPFIEICGKTLWH